MPADLPAVALDAELEPPHPDRATQELQAALAARAIVPHFQPIIAIDSGELRGFEVLARWQHGDRPWPTPDAFIPAARRSGLLGVLTLALVEQACAVAKAWPGTFYLAFNMPPTLLQDPGMVAAFLSTLRDAGFPLPRVRVEMTEVEVVEDEAAADLSIAQLHEAGIKVMLDDFGTGYSSLVRLHRFQFDKIKIDGSFIRTLAEDDASRKIVTAIVGLGKSLGAAVVAESVETPFQLQFLARIGCDACQGWLLAPAMDATTATAWLAAHCPRGMARRGPQLSPYLGQYQLEILYQRAPVGLSFIAPDLRFLAANERFQKMLDKPAQAIIGHTVAEVLPEDLQALATDIILKGAFDGVSDLRELQMPGGRETYLLSHERVIDAAGVVLGVSVVCIDITERKHYEAVMQTTRDSELGVAALNHTVLWIADDDGEVVYISPHVQDPETLPLAERVQRWYQRMHPEDRDRVRVAWQQRDTAAGEFQARFRVRCPDGEWHWVTSQARRRTSLSGTRWFGLFSDIQREVLLEQRLRELEAIGAGQPLSPLRLPAEMPAEVT